MASATLVVAWTSWWAWRAWSVSGISWHFFADGGRLLLHGSGLHVYADHPELQTGPLSLAVAALLRVLPASLARTVALVAMTAAGPLLVAALARLMPPSRRHGRLLVAALVLAPAWTVLSVRWGHLDDVLAMAAAVVALRAAAAQRPVLAGAALAAAIASKPWAVGFLPLLLLLTAGTDGGPAARARLRAAVTAVAGTALAWAPFVLADGGTLKALHPPVGLVDSSGLHTLGARGTRVPAWGRAAQLLLTPAAALAVGLARRWAGVLLVAVAVRLALDPQDNAYFVGSAALAAAVFDLLGTRWALPWTTIGTVVLLWQPFVRDFPNRLTTTTGLTHWWFAHPGAVGVVHLAWSLAAVVVVSVVKPSPLPPAPDVRERRWSQPRPARVR